METYGGKRVDLYIWEHVWKVVRNGHEPNEVSEIQSPAQKCLLWSISKLMIPRAQSILDSSLDGYDHPKITVEPHSPLHFYVCWLISNRWYWKIRMVPGVRSGPQQHLYTAKNLLSRLHHGSYKHDLSYLFQQVMYFSGNRCQVLFLKNKLVCSLTCAFC